MTRSTCFLACALVVLLACAGDDGTPPTQPFPNLGALQDAIDLARASTDPAVSRDSDGDQIPDGVEDRLGTDAADRDTDHDGLVDNFELFGAGGADRGARLPDVDGDGAIAPVDADDDGDGINDGELVDSDGDGIANYLEFYGFTYDWLTGVFTAWDGDPAAVHYLTDPLQASTDQDAFSDATEVTGIGLDVSVQPPGDHPLVPAIPNIVMELVGYTVTLNEDITYEEGHSLARGQTWNRETTQSSSYTDERSWDVGVEAGYAGGSAHFLVKANYGQSSSNTNSTSTSVASGGSILNERSWSTARSMNPTDAARIKLYVKVHNLGGAPVSNVVPTLTLKIGGLNIATFEPGNAQINMLVPGESYPDDSTVAWVIDSIDTGAGIAPIALTMTELRALESGAPVSVTVTQLLGDVMRLDAGGTWERVGDVNEYLARCDAVGANIRVDLGDGSFVHHLVYGDDSPSAPPVTLTDAMALLGVDDEAVLHFVDRDGAPRAVSLDGYAFAIDGQTLRDNGWELGDAGTDAEPPEGFALEDLRLGPTSSVLLRAPRESAGQDGPVIHFAYVDSLRGEIKACATDYQGLESVEVHNEDGSRTLALTEDIPGAGYYTGSSPEDSFLVGDDLRLIATNLAGETAERIMGTIFEQPPPREPVIRSVSLDLVNGTIYANIESGAPEDPASEIDWVRVFHPGLDGGALDLEPVVNWFEDPNGYAVELPDTFRSSNVEVVAYVAPGVYARHLVSEGEVTTAHVLGSVYLPAVIDTTGGDEEWLYSSFDLDTGGRAFGFREADNWSNSWNPRPPADLWVRVDESHRGYLFFNATYARVTSGAGFDSVTWGDIDALAPSLTAPLQLRQALGVQNGDILAIRTTEGRYAKVRVADITTSDNGWTNTYGRNIVLDYVTFETMAP